MKKLFNFSFIAGLLISLVYVFSEAAAVDDILMKLEAKDNTIISLQFKLKQEIFYSLTNEKQTSAGEVIFQKPGKMYYKQTEPLEQLIVTNSKKVWIYIKPYNQVISDSWKKWINNSIVPKSLLNFSENWSSLKIRNHFELVGEENDYYVLLMNPKEKSSWQMKFWIHKDDYFPVKTMLIAENVSITTEMSEYQVNPKVENKVFEFKIPPKAEVINNL